MEKKYKTLGGCLVKPQSPITVYRTFTERRIQKKKKKQSVIFLSSLQTLMLGTCKTFPSTYPIELPWKSNLFR